MLATLNFLKSGTFPSIQPANFAEKPILDLISAPAWQPILNLLPVLAVGVDEGDQ